MTAKPVGKSKRRVKRPAASGRTRSATLLSGIAEKASANFDENFFPLLVQHLAKTLDVDYVFVGELAHDNKCVLKVLSAHFAGRFIDNFSFDSLKTPNRGVLDGVPCIYPRGVRKMFPNDHSLADLRAECYVGVPLLGISGELLGVLAIMDRKPLRNRETVESLLQILAVRSAAEIERRHTYDELGESYRTLSTLMGNLPGMVYRCRNDKDWTLEFASEGCLALTGYSSDDFISHRRVAYGQLIHPEDREFVWNGVQAAVREKQPFQLLYRITTAHDKVKWVWEQGRGVFTPDGELLALEGFITDNSERVHAEHAVRESNTLLENVFSNPHVMIAYLDPQFNFIRVNQAYADDEGHTPEFFIGKNHFDLYPDAENQAIFQRVVDTGEPFAAHARPFEYTEQTEHPERGVTYWDWNLTPIKEEGQVIGLVLLLVNVTERFKVEAEMRKLSGAVQQTADSVIITDRQGVIEYINRAFEDTTGYTRNEAIGKKPNILKSGRYGAEFYQQLWKTILNGDVYRDVLINRKKNGELYYEEKTITPLRGRQGNITHFISTGKDITERMQTQERLHYMAHHDVLTGLPNRALFLERLSHALTRARWNKRQLAVLFLDLDRFKNINDTLGHDVGDSTLRRAAERLTDCVREGDTVARLGGDEFTVLLEDMANSNDVPNIAQKILDALSRPFDVEGRDFVVTTSIGISLHPEDGDDSMKLLRNADTAMYRAKEQGRNKYQFYSSEMSAKALEKFMLESSLRHALERQEFLLYYQPQVNLATGDIAGVEALLRWRHPELGLVSPAQFIPVAEETGLMKSIDEWVLRTACTQAQAWRIAGIAPITMTVNLSGRTFGETRVTEIVSRALASSGLVPDRLELEITEGVIMQNAQATVEMLEQLNRMGIKLAVDDFGTGYSSLSYLKRFPIDTLKIDQSFVRDVTTDDDDASIVSAIIAMGHSLKLKVIAEGVETREQLDFLRQQGCDGMQGFLFSRPLPAEEITRLLQSGKKL